MIYDKYTSNELALIALDSVTTLEYKQKSDLIRLLGDIECLADLNAQTCQKIAKYMPKLNVELLKLTQTKEYINERLKVLSDRGIVCVTIYSSNYPPLLREMVAPPLVLYCVGEVELLSTVCVGVVGSRKTLPYALKIGMEISTDLSNNGVTVVTGCADGGDRQAILGALDSGRVISVLPSGHDNVYPQTNRQLIEKVSQKGLVISEYPPEVTAKLWNFPIRNRIIAGLSKGVLILSGELSSGTRHTANYALDCGREVFCLPYQLGVTSGELCNDLIKNGASLCDGAECILQSLGLDKKAETETVFLDADEKKVFDAIKNGCESTNALIAETGFKVFELGTLISSLELKGLVARLQGNKFKPVK